MSNTPKLQADRQARATAARKAAAAKERRRRVVGASVGAVVIAAIIGVFVFVGVTKHGPERVPSWSLPADPVAAIKAAGLQVLSSEGSVQHYHAHLDIIDQGKPVTVPANIGIAPSAGLSALHTHSPDGIIHIESPDKKATYTLGQLFQEWQVKLTPDCVGTLCADGDHTLQYFVNGKQVTTDPSAVTFGAHDEIAIVYAAKGEQVNPPSTFQFPAGD